MKRSKLISIIICIIVMATGFILMFTVLKPQDKYQKVVGEIVSEPKNDFGKYTVKYYVGYKSYEVSIKLTKALRARFPLGQDILLRYKHNEPQKIRSHFYSMYFMLIIFFEFVIIFILIMIGMSTISERTKTNQELKKAHKKGLIVFCINGAIALALFFSMVYSNDVYNSFGSFNGGRNNYSFETAKMVVPPYEKLSLFDKNNKKVYYTIKPQISQNYIFEVEPSELGFGYSITDADKNELYSGIYNSQNKMLIYLESEKIYYITFSTDKDFSNQLPIVLVVKGEKTND